MNARFVHCFISAPLWATLILASCFKPTAKDNCGFPDVPEGSGSIQYVSSVCATEPGDGTKDLPFATISEAINALGGEGAILIGVGSYTENLSITQNGLSLYGGKIKKDDQRAVLNNTNNAALITIKEATRILIDGLVLQDATGAGIILDGGDLEATDLTIKDSVSDESGFTGHGIWATNGATLDLKDSTIQNNEGIGVLLTEAHGIILNNKIASNSRGGILANKASNDVEVSDNKFNSNSIFGIGVVESRGIILNNLIADTGVAEGGNIADGIHITGNNAYAEIQGNEVWQSFRSGIFLSQEVRGIILNNMVASNGMGGIWLQNGAGKNDAIEIKENQVTSNQYVGIGLSSEAYGIILNNLVANTGFLPDVDPSNAMGDAILVKTGSWAQIEDNVLNGSARAAVLAHYASADTQIIKNVGAGNSFGVIVQGGEIAEFEDLSFEPVPESSSEPQAEPPNQGSNFDEAFVEDAPEDELPVSEDPFSSID